MRMKDALNNFHIKNICLDIGWICSLIITFHVGKDHFLYVWFEIIVNIINKINH